jgi:nucleotide-binding universal stress UspA family protein
LIPTDGSDLAAKAVEQGVLFAKEIGAQITAVTVTEPFHFLSVKPSELAHADKVLGAVAAAAKSAGVAAIRFTQSTNTSIRQSSKRPPRESAI